MSATRFRQGARTPTDELKTESKRSLPEIAFSVSPTATLVVTRPFRFIWLNLRLMTHPID